MNTRSMNGGGCLILVLLFGIAAEEASAAGVDRPNILLIMGDDIGCDTLGCYGGQSYSTPRLDALAAGGMRFRHCFSMPVCHPTRVCLLTGRYPFRLGNPGWGSFPKEAESQTVAYVMKRAGYATAIAGKWQLTLQKRDPDHPQRLGFDESCLFGWHEGPRYFDPLIWQNGKLRDGLQGRYGPDVYCEFLIDFMKRNRQKPFFAYYSMALCHDVTDDLKEPVPLGPNGRYESYQEMVESMDAHVGLLLDALDRLKLRDNTVVLFTGDNGTPKSYIATAVEGKLIRKPIESRRNGKLVRGGKGELTDAGTNVPLIASWPGKVESGKEVNDLVDFSDFLATIADLGGAKTPAGVDIDGHSFAPRLRGEAGQARLWAFAQQGAKHWVRTARFKLYNDGRFFDLRADPAEKEPLVADSSPAATAVRKKLQTALDGLRD